MGLISPSEGVCHFFDLQYVNDCLAISVAQRLEQNPQVRSFDEIPLPLPSPEARSSPTPWLNPLYPLEYWRGYAEHKKRVLVGEKIAPDRDAIKYVDYWRTEALFLASQVLHAETRRLDISSVDY